MLTLSEQLLLIALDDEKGSIALSASTSLHYGIIGALLIELSLQDKIEFDRKLLQIKEPSATNDPLLDHIIQQIQKSDRSRTPKYWVQHLRRRITEARETLLHRLVERGILSKEEHKSMWIFKIQRYPTINGKPEQDVISHIRSIILEEAEPDENSAILISLIHACRLESQIFNRKERMASRKRIKEIANGEVMGTAVHSIVQGMNAALIAAVTASTVTTTINP